MATEKRLIDANVWKHETCVWCNEHFPDDPCEPSDCPAMQYIDKMPTVDAVEVVNGYTLIADEPKKVLLDRKCSICDQLMLATDNYCPMCGAKNVGEKIDGLLFADMEEIIDA